MFYFIIEGAVILIQMTLNAKAGSADSQQFIDWFKSVKFLYNSYVFTAV